MMLKMQIIPEKNTATCIYAPCAWCSHEEYYQLLAYCVSNLSRLSHWLKIYQTSTRNQLTSLWCKFDHVFITGSYKLLHLHKQSFEILDVCTTEFDHPAIAKKKKVKCLLSQTHTHRVKCLLSHTHTHTHTLSLSFSLTLSLSLTNLTKWASDKRSM